MTTFLQPVSLYGRDACRLYGLTSGRWSLGR
jgi:hypothetical protein